MIKNKLAVILLFILIRIPASADTQIHFTADVRFELTGIAAYLAGYPEYSMCRIQSYKSDIDKKFEAYRKHKLVQYLQQLRTEQGIAFDAVATSAQILLISGDSVTLHPDADPERLCIADPRWTQNTLRQYVSLLDSFYRDSDFQNFYDSHRNMYETGAALIEKYCDIDTTWFYSFFGRHMGLPDLYLSFVNGPNNYALPDRGSMPGYGILMGMSFDPRDSTQAVRFNRTMRVAEFYRTVIHELCHNFSNPLFNIYASELSEAGKTLFQDSLIRKMATECGYGEAGIMTSEWFNSLCTAMYFKEQGLLYPDVQDYDTNPLCLTISQCISFEAMRKFIWLISSINYMDEFYKHRDSYQTIADFMPQISAYYHHTSQHIEEEKEFFQSLYPHITETLIDSTSKQDTIVIRISFSQPMRTYAYSAVQHPDKDIIVPPDSKKWFNLLNEEERKKSVEFTHDRILFYIVRNGLEKGRRYGFMMNNAFYQSLMGFPMKENQFVEFIYY